MRLSLKYFGRARCSLSFADEISLCKVDTAKLRCSFLTLWAIEKDHLFNVSNLD